MVGMETVGMVGSVTKFGRCSSTSLIVAHRIFGVVDLVHTAPLALVPQRILIVIVLIQRLAVWLAERLAARHVGNVVVKAVLIRHHFVRERIAFARGSALADRKEFAERAIPLCNLLFEAVHIRSTFVVLFVDAHRGLKALFGPKVNARVVLVHLAWLAGFETRRERCCVGFGETLVDFLYKSAALAIAALGTCEPLVASAVRIGCMDARVATAGQTQREEEEFIHPDLGQ